MQTWHMARNERGGVRSGEDEAGHKERLGAARRVLPRVDFAEMNFEVRRPPYNPNGREAGDARNQGDPQQGERR